MDGGLDSVMATAEMTTRAMDDEHESVCVFHGDDDHDDGVARASAMRVAGRGVST